MKKSIVPVWFLLLGASVLLLTGCALSQPANLANDTISLVPEAIAAQNGPVIRLQPPKQQLHVGDIVAIEIQIDNVSNLSATEIELQFNPDILQAQDANSDKDGIQIQPGAFLSPDFVVANKIDNVIGIARYALTQLGATPPANGSGVLAIITFQAVAEGSSQLTFVKTQLATGDSQDIPLTDQSGQITVGQATDQPAATLTPIPNTSSPTPTVIPTDEHNNDGPTSTPGSLPDTPTIVPAVTLVMPAATPVAPTSLPPMPTTTPVPPVTDIPPGATLGSCYRVQQGDTLYSIGQKFGIASHFINIVNDLHPPGYVFPNQALFIPKQHGYGPNVYIIQAGDTLAGIADACHLPISFLTQVNDLEQTAIVQKGHVLLIPIPPFPPPSRFQYSPQSPPFAFKPAPSAPAASPGSCDYIIQPGDTLYSIGRRYDISPNALGQINGLDNPNHISAGQCLILPEY